MGSPVLSLFLLTAIFGLMAVWHLNANAAKLPPSITGFEWSQHPNTLLISYPANECGCGPAPSERVSEGLAQGEDVLVIASAPSPRLDALRKMPFPRLRFLLVDNVSENVIRRFSPRDQAVEIQVRQGQIVKGGENGNS